MKYIVKEKTIEGTWVPVAGKHVEYDTLEDATKAAHAYGNPQDVMSSQNHLHIVDAATDKLQRCITTEARLAVFSALDTLGLNPNDVEVEIVGDSIAIRPRGAPALNPALN